MNIDNPEDRALAEIRRTSAAILSLAARLPYACVENMFNGENLMRLIGSHYGQAVVGTPYHYLIAELPGNAMLYRAMESNGHAVDDHVFERLKAAVWKAVCAPFPDAGRFARGVDGALMAVSKLRREYDRTVNYLRSFQLTAPAADVPPMFAKVRQKLMSNEREDMTGLKRAFERGGVPDKLLSPIAFEALHDLVFSHTIDEADRSDFADHLHDETEASFYSAMETLPITEDIVRSNIRTIEANLQELAPAAVVEPVRLRAMVA